MFIKSVWDRIKELATVFFSTLGIIWTIIEVLKSYLPTSSWVALFSQNIFFLIFPSITLTIVKLVGILKYRYSITCKIGDVNVIIQPGDILKKTNGIIVVGTNRQMKTRKDEIAKGSIHRKLVDEYGQEKLTKVFRSGKKNTKTGMNFFQEKIDKKSFLFLLMSDLNIPGTASSTTSLLKESLDGLFHNQKNLDAVEDQLYMPLLGTGASGLQPSKQEVVKILIERYLDFQRNPGEDSSSKIKTLNIVIYWKDFYKINWVELRKWLENQKDYCFNCNK